MKKFFASILFGFIFSLATTMGIYANENIQEELMPVEPPSEEALKDATVEVYYEYKMYEDLQNTSEVNLSAQGFTPSEITTIKSKSYTDLLRERGELSTTKLRNMGYTDYQISILKKATPSQAELIELQSTNKFTFTTLVEKLVYHPNGYTYSTVYTEWEWTVTPYSLFKDDFAIAWTGNMAFMDYDENNKSRYTLFRRNNGSGATGSTTTGLYDNNNEIVGALVRVPSFNLEQVASGYTNPKGPVTTRNFTYKGAARVALKYYGQVSYLVAQGAYGHYVLSTSDFSLSLRGDVSITFNKAYETTRCNNERAMTYY